MVFQQIRQVPLPGGTPPPSVQADPRQSSLAIVYAVGIIFGLGSLIFYLSARRTHLELLAERVAVIGGSLSGICIAISTAFVMRCCKAPPQPQRLVQPIIPLPPPIVPLIATVRDPAQPPPPIQSVGVASRLVELPQTVHYMRWHKGEMDDKAFLEGLLTKPEPLTLDQALDFLFYDGPVKDSISKDFSLRLLSVLSQSFTDEQQLQLGQQIILRVKSPLQVIPLITRIPQLSRNRNMRMGLINRTRTEKDPLFKPLCNLIEVVYENAVSDDEAFLFELYQYHTPLVKPYFGRRRGYDKLIERLAKENPQNMAMYTTKPIPPLTSDQLTALIDGPLRVAIQEARSEKEKELLLVAQSLKHPQTRLSLIQIQELAACRLVTYRANYHLITLLMERAAAEIGPEECRSLQATYLRKIRDFLGITDHFK